MYSQAENQHKSTSPNDLSDDNISECEENTLIFQGIDEEISLPENLDKSIETLKIINCHYLSEVKSSTLLHIKSFYLSQEEFSEVTIGKFSEEIEEISIRGDVENLDYDHFIKLNKLKKLLLETFYDKKAKFDGAYPLQIEELHLEYDYINFAFKSSLPNFSKLRVLKLHYCREKELTNLPSQLQELSLEIKHDLDESGIPSWFRLSDCPRGLENLSVANKSDSDSLRFSAKNLSPEIKILSLVNLDLELPDRFPVGIIKFVCRENNNIESFPAFSEKLQYFDASNCSKLKVLPELPNTLSTLLLDGCDSLKPSRENLIKLAFFCRKNIKISIPKHLEPYLAVYMAKDLKDKIQFAKPIIIHDLIDIELKKIVDADEEISRMIKDKAISESDLSALNFMVTNEIKKTTPQIGNFHFGKPELSKDSPLKKFLTPKNLESITRLVKENLDDKKIGIALCEEKYKDFFNPHSYFLPPEEINSPVDNLKANLAKKSQITAEDAERLKILENETKLALIEFFKKEISKLVEEYQAPQKSLSARTTDTLQYDVSKRAKQ
jgi:hypothetical protein